MIVKGITVEDADDFCKLCENFYNSGATKRGYDYNSTMLTFRQIISRHENLWGYFIIDQETGSVAGYALITTYWCNEESGNVVILDELYVRPEFRHHGYGREFMTWLENEFKENAVSIELEVLSTNVVAKDLYAKSGYYEDGFVVLSKRID